MKKYILIIPYLAVLIILNVGYTHAKDADPYNMYKSTSYKGVHSPEDALKVICTPLYKTFKKYCELENKAEAEKQARRMIDKFPLFAKSATMLRFKPPYSPIHLTVQRGLLDTTQKFIDLGVNINMRDPNNGLTLLHIAAMKNNVKMVELLLAHQADVNAIDQHMFSPLHYVALHGNVETAPLLLAHGIDNAILFNILLNFRGSNTLERDSQVLELIKTAYIYTPGILEMKFPSF